MESRTQPARSLVLNLPARPENVAVVRHALAGLADTVGMDPVAVGDLKTVVTEACMNVVEHAYDEVGPLEVAAELERDDALVVVIRDRGRGMRPRVGAARPSLRIGLALIASLSERFEIGECAGGGTELRLTMPFQPRDADPDEPAQTAPIEDETVITVPAGDLVAPVLTRVVSMLASRADFSVDRLSDTMLVSDAIASQAADGFVEGIAKIVVSEAEGRVRVRVRPLTQGGADKLLSMMEVPELDLSLRKLADEIAVESNGEVEELRLVFEPRSAA